MLVVGRLSYNLSERRTSVRHIDELRLFLVGGVLPREAVAPEEAADEPADEEDGEYELELEDISEEELAEAMKEEEAPAEP